MIDILGAQSNRNCKFSCKKGLSRVHGLVKK